MRKYVLTLACILLSILAQAQLSGNSLQLKANGNYVSVADASSASLSNTMTWEFWIYFRCENGIVGTTPISKGWCGTSWSYYIAIENQKLGFWKTNPTGTGTCPSGAHVQYESDSSVVPYNTWTHVAIVQTGSTVQFFVNGLPESNSIISGSAFTGIKSSGRPVLLGAYQSLGGSYVSVPKSNLDDIRIWNTARTQAEIQANMNAELIGNETGLVAYWKLNETGSGAGITVVNSATTTSGTFNGTTVGTAANLVFNNNNTIIDALPTCDPVLWLKADAGTYTNAGTILATDGQPIQQWNDQSANTYHCTQADLSKRPIWQANAFYGKPALWFDGVNGNYWLENATQTPVATAGMPRTYFVVAKAACDATGYAGGHLFTNRRSPNASTLEFVKNGSSIYHGGNFCCNHPEVTNVNFDEGRLQPFVGTWRTGGTNTNLDFWLNGVSKTTSNANFVADNGNAGYCVGDRRDAFQFDSPTGAYDWQGHIAEIIVYNYALTNKQRVQVENYLKNKYKAALPLVFTSTPNTSSYNTQTLNDAVWDHSYNASNNNEIIASVKDYCLDLGTRTDTVYVEANPLQIGSAYAMRRHYTINTSLNPVGTKRVRLYYTDADYTNLQTMVPSLTSHGQLVVTKYSGPNEDGTFNSTGGTLTLIPSAQITTGTVFGQRYLEFDVDGFSEFWIHTGNFALPVEIKNFAVSHCNTNACLQWTVGEENNVSHYEVEKSADGISFERVGNVDAMHKSSYTFTDTNPYAGRNYYRLKVVDIDAKYNYSSIQSLDFAQGQWNVSIIPTYSENGRYTLQSNKSIQTIQIYTSNGSLLRSIHSPTQILDMSDLSKGMYFIKVNTVSESEMLKVMR